jgi:hypothetical protein|tara:strand:- start:1135 stop:1425 length:291 start_codon:yes stop_codon:yes gene_type:complete
LADETPTEYFVERVANMSHANGVFRITFAQQAEGDALRPQVRLMIPANQLSPILQGISNAAKDIGEQVQARIEESQEPDAGADKQAAPKKAKAPKS